MRKMPPPLWTTTDVTPHPATGQPIGKSDLRRWLEQLDHCRQEGDVPLTTIKAIAEVVDAGPFTY